MYIFCLFIYYFIQITKTTIFNYLIMLDSQIYAIVKTGSIFSNFSSIFRYTLLIEVLNKNSVLNILMYENYLVHEYKSNQQLDKVSISISFCIFFFNLYILIKFLYAITAAKQIKVYFSSSIQYILC